MQVTFGQAPGVGAQTSRRQPKFGLFKRDKAKPAAPETGAQKAPEQAKPTVAIPTVRSKEAFDAAIAGEKPVLVKFEKKDCPACQEAEPVVQRLADDNAGGLTVIKAWMWDPENPDNRSMKKIAGQYKFQTVPYFILFKNGQAVGQGEGLKGLQTLAEENGIAIDTYPAHLPKPYKPDGAELTVLFDGECEICKGYSKKLRKLDKNDKLALVPLQAPEVRDRYPDLKLSDLREAIHVVNAEGEVFKGAEAFREMGRVIKSRTPLARAIRAYTRATHLPGVLPVSDKLYLAFSKRRFMIKANRSDCANCKLED